MTNWDVSTFRFLQSKSLSADATANYSLFFKPDGLKMYILRNDGGANVGVNEYTLTTAWDISSASFIQFKSVSTEDTNPYGLFFKPDGTKMYVGGITGQDVNEYDLSSAWDISSASFLQAESISVQETAPRDLFFKPDGTKMYVLGGAGVDVNEYDLGSAWDISSASFLQAESISVQETAPRGLYFKPDGTKMYVTGFQGQDVNEYDLGSAWDISSASFLQAKSLVSGTSDPNGIFFKPDGTKMYVVIDVDAEIYEYNLKEFNAELFADKNTFWVNNSGTWMELNHYEYFKVKKIQNQVSEFEIKIFDISTAQKAYFKEQAEVLFFCGTKMILKGRIQTIEYGEAFEVIARGFGMESLLLDKEFISSGDNRVQYTNDAPSSIADEIVDGGSSYILTIPNDDGAYKNVGLFDEQIDSEEDISMRFEYANRLNALAKLSETIEYDWWVTQTSSDNYSANYIMVNNYRSSPIGTETHYVAPYGPVQLIHGVTSSGDEVYVGRGVTRYVNAKVSSLAFTIRKYGSPTGSAAITIRKHDLVGQYGTLIASEEFDVSTLGTTSAWKEVTFSSTPDINGRVNLAVEYSGGDSSNAVVMDYLATTDGDPAFPSEQFIGYEYYDNGSSSALEIESVPTNYKIQALVRKDYTITNSSMASQERDLTNLTNYVKVLGYGDGVNQLKTSVYAASTQSSVLALNITSTDSSIKVLDSSPFSSSGVIRIAEEQISYSGINANTLTGCTREVNSTTALAHNRNCYVEEQHDLDSPETGSSIQTYGLMDYTIVNKNLIDLETAEVVASKYLADRKSPIIRIKVRPDEPFDLESLEVGDYVNVVDSESDISDNLKIVGITYISNYGHLTAELSLSNRSLEFVEQMNKTREKQEEASKYMQGSTNIYAISESENCDNTTDLDMRFFIPNEAVAINKVLLNFNLKGYRAYSKASEGGSSHTHDTSISAGGGHDHNIGRIFADWPTVGYPLSSGVGATEGAATHTHGSETSDADTAHTHNMTYGIEEQSLTSPSVVLKVGPDGGSLTTIDTYATDQTEIDITDEVTAVGAGNWVQIKFEANKNMRIEANAYVQIFIEST